MAARGISIAPQIGGAVLEQYRVGKLGMGAPRQKMGAAIFLA
jgi:hypothetical protein